MSDTTVEKAFVRVAAAGEIDEHAAKIVTIGRYDVAIFKVGDEFKAYENVCPHQGGPVGEGIVDGATVTCPWHAWCFDLRTGKLTLGDFAELRSFESYVEGGAIFISTQPRDG